VQASTLLDEYGQRLREVGGRLHDARASVLAGAFDGYVEDTYHVGGVGYVCWPAMTDGRFDAYDDCCGREERAVDRLVTTGFERVAVGLSRVVLLAPGGDHVVKLARCGMGDAFGDGRRENLVEARLSADVDTSAPVVPSLHCEPRGTYAVYPFVERRGPGVTGPDSDGSVADVREWLAERAPWLDLDEAIVPENRCVWRGRLRTLDYSFADTDGPLGVPDHVDHERVVAAVDRQRRTGEKRDLADGGGFVEPEVG
jgi:hypothetical protein